MILIRSQTCVFTNSHTRPPPNPRSYTRRLTGVAPEEDHGVAGRRDEGRRNCTVDDDPCTLLSAGGSKKTTEGSTNCTVGDDPHPPWNAGGPERTALRGSSRCVETTMA